MLISHRTVGNRKYECKGGHGGGHTDHYKTLITRVLNFTICTFWNTSPVIRPI